MEDRRVRRSSLHCSPSFNHHSETNLDDVLQISNVFVNVSKGEAAKSGDLQKAFGKLELGDIVKEVGILLSPFRALSHRTAIPHRVFRFLRREKSKLGRKNVTTTSHHSAKKSRLWWEKNAWIRRHSALIPLG